MFNNHSNCNVSAKVVHAFMKNVEANIKGTTSAASNRYPHQRSHTKNAMQTKPIKLAEEVT